MSQAEEKAYRELRKLAIKTSRQLKELRKHCNHSNPVDMDMLKTTKAMFYEEALTIFKRAESQKRKEEN